MRLIDADALGVGRCSEKLLPHAYCVGWNGLVDLIEKAPTIEAEPVKHGRWVHDYSNVFGCTECLGRECMSPYNLRPYCPNCGAKMDGERKEE